MTGFEAKLIQFHERAKIVVAVVTASAIYTIEIIKLIQLSLQSSGLERFLS